MKFKKYMKVLDRTYIILGFPGVGKSTCLNSKDLKWLDMSDSDSSKFDKSDFPNNYIKHIHQLLDKKDVIFVSTHKEVREAILKDEYIKKNATVIIAYPDISLKDEYVKRYEQRGSSQQFINLLKEHWEEWIIDIEKEDCKKIILKSADEYLEEYVSQICSLRYIITKPPKILNEILINSLKV